MSHHLQSRLNNLRQYLEEAKKNPKENELYIADLELSIPMFEQQIAAGVVIVNEGFKNEASTDRIYGAGAHTGPSSAAAR